MYCIVGKKYPEHFAFSISEATYMRSIVPELAKLQSTTGYRTVELFAGTRGKFPRHTYTRITDAGDTTKQRAASQLPPMGGPVQCLVQDFLVWKEKPGVNKRRDRADVALSGSDQA
jgi:hypothetical protein